MTEEANERLRQFLTMAEIGKERLLIYLEYFCSDYHIDPKCNKGKGAIVIVNPFNEFPSEGGKLVASKETVKIVNLIENVKNIYSNIL